MSSPVIQSEDLDDFVERCAAKLLSDVPSEIRSGFQMLKQAHASKDATEFYRKAQELAVFRGGSVLSLLLERVADIKDPGNRTYKLVGEEAISQSDEEVAPHGNGSGIDRLSLPCILGLVELGASKVVVESLMRDASNARMLALQFVSKVSYGLEALLSEREKGTVLPFFLIEAGLGGLVNFSRSSRVFREALRQLPSVASLFEDLESICMGKVLGRLNDVVKGNQVLKILVSSLMLSLSFSPDSQVWAIENGLLKVVSAIYASTHRRELSSLVPASKILARTRSPAYRCNLALILLAESEASRRKLMQVDGLSLLKVHKGIIDSVQPEHQPWKYLKERVSEPIVSRPECGVEVRSMSLINDSTWKLLRRLTCGFYPWETVCSWKMCNAGLEPRGGVAYSRCARCQLARYCSKEHQKLHWQTHKKHCRAMPTRRNSKEEEPGSA